jgi:hypothetical protein
MVNVIDIYVYHLETARPRVQPQLMHKMSSLNELLESISVIPKHLYYIYFPTPHKSEFSAVVSQPTQTRNTTGD